MTIDIQPKAQTPDQSKAPKPDRPNPYRTLPPSSRQTRPKAGAGWSRGVVVLVLLGVPAAGAAFLLKSADPTDGKKVLTHTIGRGDLVVSVTEDGTLESSDNREIKCKVKGGSTVLWVVESGAAVEKGDVLVRLDTSKIEENINAQRIVYEDAVANKAAAESDVAVAKISITEYLEGTFKAELATKEKELVVAQSNLKAAKSSQEYAQTMFRKGYLSKLELETKADGLKHAQLDVEVKQIELDALKRFTKAKKLKELESALAAAEARLESDTATLKLEKARLSREEKQLDNCVIRAEVAGMVIYPSAAEWRQQPDIEEGATVREDQILLLMPNLKRMQAKVGIHESKIDGVKPGMEARVELPDRTVTGEVTSIASVTKPTGWWTGNLVKYDTIVRLDEQDGLKPGMSVAVEVFLARHENVLTIPVAAVMDQGNEFACWIATDGGLVKRPLKLGESNEQFIVVRAGLKEGDRVVLNPLDFVDEAQRAALKPAKKGTPDASDTKEEKPGAGVKKPDSGSQESKREKPDAEILESGKKRADEALTENKLDEKVDSHQVTARSDP